MYHQEGADPDDRDDFSDTSPLLPNRPNDSGSTPREKPRPSSREQGAALYHATPPGEYLTSKREGFKKLFTHPKRFLGEAIGAGQAHQEAKGRSKELDGRCHAGRSGDSGRRVHLQAPAQQPSAQAAPQPGYWTVMFPPSRINEQSPGRRINEQSSGRRINEQSSGRRINVQSSGRRNAPVPNHYPNPVSAPTLVPEVSRVPNEPLLGSMSRPPAQIESPAPQAKSPTLPPYAIAVDNTPREHSSGRRNSLVPNHYPNPVLAPTLAPKVSRVPNETLLSSLSRPPVQTESPAPQAESPTVPPYAIDNISCVSMNSLPLGWYEGTSSKGRTYYYSDQGIVQWQRPTGLTSPSPQQPSDALPPGWFNATSRDGRQFYYNNVGGKQWDRPTLPSNQPSNSGSPVPIADGSRSAHPKTPVPVVEPLPHGWFEAKADNGRVYYYTMAGIRKWTRPTTPASHLPVADPFPDQQDALVEQKTATANSNATPAAKPQSKKDKHELPATPTTPTRVASKLVDLKSVDSMPVMSKLMVPKNASQQPVAVKPPVSQPLASKPNVLISAAPEAAVPKPASSKPVALQPAVSNPVVSEPAISESTNSNHTITLPIVIKPVVVHQAVVAPDTTASAGATSKGIKLGDQRIEVVTKPHTLPSNGLESGWFAPKPKFEVPASQPFNEEIAPAISRPTRPDELFLPEAPRTLVTDKPHVNVMEQSNVRKPSFLATSDRLSSILKAPPPPAKLVPSLPPQLAPSPSEKLAPSPPPKLASSLPPKLAPSLAPQLAPSPPPNLPLSPMPAGEVYSHAESIADNEGLSITRFHGPFSEQDSHFELSGGASPPGALDAEDDDEWWNSPESSAETQSHNASNTKGGEVTVSEDRLTGSEKAPATMLSAHPKDVEISQPKFVGTQTDSWSFGHVAVDSEGPVSEPKAISHPSTVTHQAHVDGSTKNKHVRFSEPAAMPDQVALDDDTVQYKQKSAEMPHAQGTSHVIRPDHEAIDPVSTHEQSAASAVKSRWAKMDKKASAPLLVKVQNDSICSDKDAQVNDAKHTEETVPSFNSPTWRASASWSIADEDDMTGQRTTASTSKPDQKEFLEEPAVAAEKHETTLPDQVLSVSPEVVQVAQDAPIIVEETDELAEDEWAGFATKKSKKKGKKGKDGQAADIQSVPLTSVQEDLNAKPKATFNEHSTALEESATAASAVEKVDVPPIEDAASFATNEQEKDMQEEWASFSAKTTKKETIFTYAEASRLPIEPEPKPEVASELETTTAESKAKPKPDKEEPAVDPFVGLSKSQKKKLQEKIKKGKVAAIAKSGPEPLKPVEKEAESQPAGDLKNPSGVTSDAKPITLTPTGEDASSADATKLDDTAVVPTESEMVPATKDDEQNTEDEWAAFVSKKAKSKVLDTEEGKGQPTKVTPEANPDADVNPPTPEADTVDMTDTAVVPTEADVVSVAKGNDKIADDDDWAPFVSKDKKKGKNAKTKISDTEEGEAQPSKENAVLPNTETFDLPSAEVTNETDGPPDDGGVVTTAQAADVVPSTAEDKKEDDEWASWAPTKKNKKKDKKAKNRIPDTEEGKVQPPKEDVVADTVIPSDPDPVVPPSTELTKETVALPEDHPVVPAPELADATPPKTEDKKEDDWASWATTRKNKKKNKKGK